MTQFVTSTPAAGMWRSLNCRLDLISPKRLWGGFLVPWNRGRSRLSTLWEMETVVHLFPEDSRNYSESQARRSSRKPIPIQVPCLGWRKPSRWRLVELLRGPGAEALQAGCFLDGWLIPPIQLLFSMLGDWDQNQQLSTEYPAVMSILMIPFFRKNKQLILLTHASPFHRRARAICDQRSLNLTGLSPITWTKPPFSSFWVWFGFLNYLTLWLFSCQISQFLLKFGKLPNFLSSWCFKLPEGFLFPLWNRLGQSMVSSERDSISETVEPSSGFSPTFQATK